MLLNYICGSYFGLGRKNIVYSLCYLIAGALIYLYRKELEELSRKYWYVSFAFATAAVVMYYAISSNTIFTLLVAASLLIYALGKTRGGYYRTNVPSFSVPLAWRFI